MVGITDPITLFITCLLMARYDALINNSLVVLILLITQYSEAVLML